MTYDLPLAHLLKKYNDEDPPAQPKLAVPVSTVKKICKHYKFSDHHRAVANLCTIAFFYLLRVGEYTTPTHNANARSALQPFENVISACGARTSYFLTPPPLPPS